jgi:[ribosomal protein S18]-alanine N-acetyltransferase
VQIAVKPMRLEHIPVVGIIERESFSQTWPLSAYRKELQTNKMAHYYVARRQDGPAFTPAELGLSLPASSPEPSLVGRLSRIFFPPPEPIEPGSEAELCRIVGYAGLWLMVDEAHITTIAVHPKYRGEGVGELLLLQMIDTAQEAQALYHKYTFKEMGVRRRYYSDDGEDALVMWTEPIDSELFVETVARCRAALEARLTQNA